MDASPFSRIRLFTRVVVPLLSASLLLAACGSPAAPGQPTHDLQGLWLVTPGPGTFYGAGGTTTLEFGAGTGGSATFLSQADDNDITTCERHVYAKLAENVLLLNGTYYVADKSDADTFTLSNDTETITLSKLEGAGPVAPCGEASATLLGSYPRPTGGFSTLSSYGTNLYFNIDEVGDPIVSYDVSTDSFGAPRVYSYGGHGGTHRWVVAAKTDDLFYGHCACGYSERANEFNLATDTSVDLIETDVLGAWISVRYGYLIGNELVIGGRSNDVDGVNTLLPFDAATLALLPTRNILDGARIIDIAPRGDDLLALVGRNLIVVGDDGRAEETLSLPTGITPRGLATIGTQVYVYAGVAAGESGIYEVTLP